MTLFCLSSRKVKKYPVYHVNPVKCLVLTLKTGEHFEFSAVERMD